MDLSQIVRTEKFKGGRSGRRDYGRIHTLANGQVIYLAKRKRDEIYCCGAKSISDAIRNGTAEWAIDDDTLLKLRIAAVKFVGVCENTSGDIWLTSVDTWFDPKKYAYRNYEGRGGSLQRYVNFRHFRTIHGAKDLTTKIVDKEMKKLGRLH